MKKIVFVYHANGVFSKIPCAVNIVNKLAANNFDVHIFTISNDSYGENPNLPSSNRIVYNYFDSSKVWLAKFSTSLAFYVWVIKKNLFPRLIHSSSSVIHFGIDFQGLLIAWIMSFIIKGRVYFQSFEMNLTWAPVLPKWMTILENILIKKVEGVIIHDQLRAKMYKEDKKLFNIPFFLIANSFSGNSLFVKSEFLHNRLSIDHNIPILLYQGSAGDWAWSHSVLMVFQSHKLDYKLVFHVNEASKSEVLGDFELSDLINVEFSTANLPIDAVKNVVESCDVGLVIYEHPSPNTHYVGYSSGKLCQYLKSGKPIICNDIPLISNHVREFGSGVIVSSAEEIPAAFLRIMAEYDEYSTNAVKHYNAQINPDIEIIRLLSELDKL